MILIDAISGTVKSCSSIIAHNRFVFNGLHCQRKTRLQLISPLFKSSQNEVNFRNNSA